MQRFLALLLDYDKNDKALADRIDLYQKAPRAPSCCWCSPLNA